MKRPFDWFRTFAVFLVGAIAGIAVVLRWAAPQYVIHVLERVSKGRLLIERSDFSWPFTADLIGVRALHNTDAAAVSAQRVSVTPRWLSMKQRTAWIDRLDIDRPIFRLSRAGGGAFILPDVPGEAVRTPSGGLNLRSWRVHIATLTVSNGVVEFIDQKSGQPFHGILDHVSLIIGPVTLESKPAGGVMIIPIDKPGTSFALRGRLIGHQAATAPVYCSGWLDVATNDMQASCRLEPLPMVAFEPYFSRGAAQLRVYTATLKSASQWWSRANQFTGRVHLELNNLSEGDFSYRGRTIFDIKRMPGGAGLTGEVTIAGPLDDPAAWQAQLLPGDDRVQLVLDQLRERGVTTLKIGLEPRILHVRLTKTTAETRSEMEANSKAIKDALEILAGPPELPPVAAPEPPAPIVTPVPSGPIPNGKTVAPAPAPVQVPAP
jgi:hypothetical protein